jgi:hypothetical protein
MIECSYEIGKHIVTCMSLIRRVLVQKIGFLDSWVTQSLIITLKYRLYSAVSHLHQLQFIVAHTLWFSVSTSSFPVPVLDAQTVAVSGSNYYTRRKYFNYTLSLLMATNFPLLLHFDSNCHVQQRSDFDNSLLGTLVNLYWTELPSVSP